jgi:hypothetical protein
MTWSSDLEAPSYRVYVDGRLALETDLAEYLLRAEAGEYPVIEVLDDPDALPESLHPPRLDLWWLAVLAADYYRVDEYVNAAWIERARLREDGSGAYRWRSRVLEDEAVHEFRVVAVGADGNEAMAVERSALMVRVPDPPDAAYVYDVEAGTVTMA